MATTTDRTTGAGQAWRGLLLVSAAGVVWGTIGPGAELTHDRSGLSPWTITAYRAVAAVLALVTATLVLGRARLCLSLVRGHRGRVVATGVATATFQLLFFVAVVAAGVSVPTVVALGLAPVLLLVVGSVQRRRAPSSAQLVTVAAALAGLGLVSLSGGAGDRVDSPVLGVLAAIGSGTAYAVSTHVAAPLSRQHDALAVTTVTMSVAACLLVPGGLATAYLRGEAMGTSDPWSWLLLVHLGVVTMAFAYVLLYAGLRSTTSGSAVVATLLEPVTAVLIAVLFLGEHLTAPALVGALLIVGAIATLGRQVEQQPPPQ